MVWGAYVDVGKGVGTVKKFGGGAEVGDGLPDKKRLRAARIQDLSTTEDGGHEIDAAGR